MNFNNIFKTGVAIFLLSGNAMAASVDLSNWKTNGGKGKWTVQTGNDAVLQENNSSRPTFFYNDKDSQGLALSGEITVKATSDDDFIGFVLGYNTDDYSNESADYILIDWKQADQSKRDGSDLGKEGLAISRVTGALNKGSHLSNSAWDHSGVVTELARATNLGSTGWVDKKTYSFDLIFTASLIEVFIGGVKELSISSLGLFNNGSFGFYNHSQRGVLYAGIKESKIPGVPVPAALFLFGPVLLGFMGLRRKVKAIIA